MPPAYYKYGDNDVIEFYTKIIDAFQNVKLFFIILKNLCGYKFSIDVLKNLLKNFLNK